MYKGKTVVLGVTGGIAAYKSLDIISKLKKRDINVKVILTDSATEFIKPLSFQALSANFVSSEMFEEPKSFQINHISLAKEADVLLVAPATANIIGKVANGIADDLLSTTIMATKSQVIFAPAMNTNMYENPIVQENINKLKKLNYLFIQPDYGRLACGDTGNGKLADVDKIVDTVLCSLYPIKDMVGKKVLVTAGPTIAAIDPVRIITNRSTGKMGYAIAEEAIFRGAEVTLISGPVNIKPPYGANLVKVETNTEMLNKVLEFYDNSDIVIKSAAVSDYKPKDYSTQKIKKKSEELAISFVKDNDILLKLGELKKNQILVGFAAESNDLLSNAKAKLEKKNLDYIVANDISKIDTGFASDYNKVTVLCRDKDNIEFLKMTKREVAKALFDIINTKR